MMRKFSLILAVAVLGLTACQKEFMELKNKKGVKSSNYTELKSNCIQDVFGEWELTAVEDSIGNPSTPYWDTLKFSTDTCQWFPDTTWHNIYGNYGNDYPVQLFNVDCENGTVTIGHMSCGVFFATYRITTLNNNWFIFEYDRTLNGGQSNWIDGYRLKYRRV